jgi:hypothetical protein
MKSESKNLPGILSNPINRDLSLILISGLVAAVVIVTAGAMLINQL